MYDVYVCIFTHLHLSPLYILCIYLRSICAGIQGFLFCWAALCPWFEHSPLGSRVFVVLLSGLFVGVVLVKL